MAETIKGITVVLGADTTALGKALGDVNKKSKDIQSELKQVDKLLKFDGSNTDVVTQKQKLLADAIANTNAKLSKLKEAQEQVNEQFAQGKISEGQYRAFEREVIATEQELQKLEQQLKDTNPEFSNLGNEAEKAGEKLDSTSDKLKKVGDGLTGAGKSMSTYVTAPIVGLGALATKTAIDFESAFAGVRKTVDATEEEFADLEKGIRDMSQQMPASASDIAKVAEAAGQLGIETPNILAFTKTMIGLGEATNLSAEEGATQFARFANIVGMSQGDFERLGSSVVALGNNFATTEAEIVAMGMRLAGQGAQIGMTESQIMALAAAMSSVGIEAEAGGTAMSTTLKNMQVAVDEAGGDLENFSKVAGMTSEEFAKLFREDSAGALTAFVNGLAGAASEGENLTMILNDLGIKGIRESDTLLRLAGASDVLSSALDVSSNAWEENSALSNEVAQRYGTTESQLAMLKNTFSELAIEIGKILIPILRDIVDFVKPIVKSFSEMDESTQKVILVIAGIAAAIGPLLIIIGQVVTAISALAPVFAALTGPIGLVIAAIIALGAAIYLIIDNWEYIEEFFVNLWSAIVDYATEEWNKLVEMLTTVWETIKNVATNLWNGIVDGIMAVISPLIEMMSNIWGAIKDDVVVVFEAIKTFFSAIWDVIKLIFGGALLLLINLVTGDFEELKKNATAIFTKLKDAFSVIWDSIKTIFSGSLSAISKGITAAWDSIKTISSNTWNAIVSFITGIFDKLKTAQENMTNSIREGLNKALEWITGLPSKLKDLGKDIIQGLINGITSMITKVKDTVKNVAESITNGLKNMLNINSPSKVTAEIGMWTGEGLAVGLEKSLASVSKQAEQLATVAVPQVEQASMPKTTNQNFSFEGFMSGAVFNVRSDNDIHAIARELFNLQQTAIRGAGI